MDKNATTEFISGVNGTDDREALSKFWIAVDTRPRSENKAVKEISNSDIKTYLPTQTILKQWSDRKKKVECVVIPMIVFAKVSQKDVPEVSKHPLVSKILTFPGQKDPARIPDNQISRLKFMLDESDEPVVFEQAEFKKLDKVRVIRGNLSGLDGEIIRTDDGHTKLLVSIDILGGATVTINPIDLEIIQ